MKIAARKLYDEIRVLDAPRYPVVQAAHYLQVPQFTLHNWLRPVKFRTLDGYASRPVIQRPKNTEKLSFLNLIEAHVVKALLKLPQMNLPVIRASIEFVEARPDMGVKRLLISAKMTAGAGGIFVKHLGDLLNAGKAGQYAMETILESYLQRIEFGEEGPYRLHPFVYDRNEKIVSISPFVAFGNAVVSKRAISTAAIVERFNAGETKSDLAKDYRIEETEVEEAILYESAA